MINYRKALLEMAEKLRSLALRGTPAYFVDERFGSVNKCIILEKNLKGYLISAFNNSVDTHVNNDEVYENEIDAYKYLIKIYEVKAEHINDKLTYMKERMNKLLESQPSKSEE